MNALIILIPRYLRHQSRRTFMTALGIVLAVALVAAVGILGATINRALVDQAVEQTANYHAMFSEVTPAEVAAWEQDPALAAVGLASDLGVHHLDNIFISIEGYDARAREIFGLALEAGRFPENPGEIALESWIFEYLALPAEPGQTLTLPFRRSWRDSRDARDRSRSDRQVAEFTVVGILENLNGKTMGASLGLVAPEMVAQNLPEGGGTSRAFLRVAPASDPRPTIARLAARAGVDPERISYNETLLAALENEEATSWPQIFLVGIVVVVTVATIYNVFQIAVLERRRQFGLLRALGATRRQIWLFVLGEGFILASLAIPCGLLLGVGAAAGLRKLTTFLEVVTGPLVVPGRVLLGAAGLGMVATLLSAFLPAIFAGRVTPLAALAGYRGVRQGNHNRLGVRLSRHLSISARMAYQNLWRNRHRSLVTIFSLGLGVVLFLSFSAWAASADSATVAAGLLEGDYALTAQGIQPSVGFGPEVAEVVSGLDGVESVRSFQVDYSVELMMPLADVAPESAGRMREDPALPTGLGWMPATLLAYGEGELAASEPFLTAGTVDPAALAGSAAALVYDPQQTSALRVGDQVPVGDTYLEEDRALFRQQTFTIVGVVDELSLSPTVLRAGPTLIVHQAQFQAFTQNHLYKRVDLTLAEGADVRALEAQLQALADANAHGSLLSFEEEVATLEAQKREMLFMAYGLVAIIVIIAVVNIVNTITTNLILRTREFGMLRAVGSTGSQLRRMTRLEGAFYGLLSALWSVPFGLSSAYLLYHLLRREMTYLHWSLPWPAALLAGASCILVGIVATIAPMHRLGKLDVVEALRTID